MYHIKVKSQYLKHLGEGNRVGVPVCDETEVERWNVGRARRGSVYRDRRLVIGWKHGSMEACMEDA